MKNLIIAALFTCTCILSYSQSNSISSSVSTSSVLAQLEKYAFDEFQEGKIIFKDTFFQCKLNYDYNKGVMEFIDPGTKKILAVGNAANLIEVIIDNRYFIPLGKGTEFIEILTKGNPVLAVKRNLIIEDKSQPNSSFNSFDYNYGVKKNTEKYLKEEKFYLVNNENRILIKGLKSFVNAYPSKYSSRIEKYVKSQNFDFTNVQELKELVGYCNSL